MAKVYIGHIVSKIGKIVSATQPRRRANAHRIKYPGSSRVGLGEAESYYMFVVMESAKAAQKLVGGMMDPWDFDPSTVHKCTPRSLTLNRFVFSQ
jgi:hypothetical protein